jgi:DNA-binding transcriptional regulator YhcF (GntR family)
MTTDNIYSLFRLNEQSATPKYRQIINCITKAVREGTLRKDYLLPSINDFSYELNLSRSTVQRVYGHLKKIGILESFPGKGYTINCPELVTPSVFLLFDNLSRDNKLIYEALVTTLGEQASIEFNVYNNDFNLFKRLLRNRKKEYHYFVIVPHLLERDKQLADIVNELPEGSLILLDKFIGDVKGPYGAIYENYEKDIYMALKNVLLIISKYQKLNLVLPSSTYYPEEIVKGLQLFCKEFAFEYQIVYNLVEKDIYSGELYITQVEEDLLVLLSKIKKTSFQVGRDIGIISYNEAPWKEFLLEGITTISTDFRMMGEIAANMILQKEKIVQEVPFTLTLRNSI